MITYAFQLVLSDKDLLPYREKVFCRTGQRSFTGCISNCRFCVPEELTLGTACDQRLGQCVPNAIHALCITLYTHSVQRYTRTVYNAIHALCTTLTRPDTHSALKSGNPKYTPFVSPRVVEVLKCDR
jgi:hypothetical protein